ncbi:MAG: ankyrin repeat domain-containing protein, partial [Synergistaceae bacterium]|nr:ankyrin repeat domain-containing protein [Synergistaceae bacterium]
MKKRWIAFLMLFILCGATTEYLIRRAQNEKNAALLGLSRGVGEIERIKLLVKSGADVNARDGEGNTALSHFLRHYVQFYSYSHRDPWFEKWAKDVNDIVRMFLDAGVEVNATNNAGETALMLAAASDSFLDVIRTLVEAGADVNARDARGNSAMMKALIDAPYSINSRAREFDLDGLVFLLDSGLDLSSLRGDKETVLETNRYSGYYRQDGGLVSFYTLPVFFIERLLTACDWSQQEKNNALLNARSGNRLDMDKIESLVRHGADVNARNAEGRNFLMNIPDTYRDPYTEYRGRVRIIPDTISTSRLIELGLDVNVCDSDGNTLLTLTNGDQMTPEYLSLLLQNSADIHAVSDQGRTCLHVPRSGPSLQVLLDAGADPNATDDLGQTPLHVVLANDPEGFQKSQKSPILTPLHVALVNAPEAPLTALISAGADVNRRDNAGKTPLLSWMERAGHPQGIRLLLDAGADVVTTDTAGNFPLMSAMRYSAQWIPEQGFAIPPEMNYAHYAREFLQRGADPNVTLSDGQTPL